MEKIKINQRKNEVWLQFNEQFYQKKYIDQAAVDFKDVCGFRKSKDYLVLKPKEKEDISTIGYEFYNYVLGLMKNQ